MKHIDFSRPLRLINPYVKKGNVSKKKISHERILFTKRVIWPPDPKKYHDSPTRERFQK